MMTIAVENPSNLVDNGNNNTTTNDKKSRESERRRRRRKLKKIHKNQNNNNNIVNETDDDSDDAKENSDPKQPVEVVEIEYVPEKADLRDDLLDEFKKIFEKFCFTEVSATGLEGDDKKDEVDKDEVKKKKKEDSDSDEEEDDDNKKEKGGISNKKKKLQRRMNVAELKQICTRPDVVEVWDATAADPKLLVYLKSYRNTVPVPRHWCQKRKFLQGL